MTLENSELENLEKKYMNVISEILSNNIGRFVNEMNSQGNLPEYSPTAKANPIEAAAENIMNAMIARRLDWGIASMPGASDSCYECGDSIVHIDAKTIKDIDGDTKSNRISVRQNQASFDFDNIHEVIKRTGKKFYWKPKLHRYEKHKIFGKIPNLTYIIKIIWSDKSLVEQISVVCLPNGQFFESHKTILESIKVYPRNGKTATDNIRFNIKTLTNIDNWREIIIYKKNN